MGIMVGRVRSVGWFYSGAKKEKEKMDEELEKKLKEHWAYNTILDATAQKEMSHVEALNALVYWAETISGKKMGRGDEGWLEEMITEELEKRRAKGPS